ncbi:MAG: SDR family NAD(P)-dependent oxidoreductase [Longimicrobiaceae bacterium]
MKGGVALVGMACRYPGARTPAELWENVLAGRRAFRRIPDERLRLADYGAPSGAAGDRTCATRAAVIEGYAFDRARFRVSGSAFRAADLAHWLALEVAADALADAGFADGRGLPRERTGVLVGNSLTGEFSRAGVLRLRWPYVRRVMEATLAEAGCAPAERRRLLAAAEARFKAPFPPVGADTLAGALSNTIAGRICNHFDLGGGGWTVDGACASSLLAVVHACAALEAGELEVALAGGVDLSLDPLELVGFARAGALSPGAMRVYDARPTGFCPGEGCGMVVLMREADARARGLHPYAVLRGWGVSSDGAGGLTRPEAAGQLRAFRRAYARAGFGPGSIGFFEGHGTGTEVGDAVELEVMARARAGDASAAAPAAVGSVKALIGHTKAAAGAAGLIKAALALRAGVIPPTIGCDEPHPLLLRHAALLRAPARGEPWPAELPPRAAVSAMGFGGINVHVVLEREELPRPAVLPPAVAALLRSAQDAELLPLSAPGPAALRGEVERLAALADRLSDAELTDLAVHLQRADAPGAARAAVVAASPGALADGLRRLLGWMDGGERRRIDLRAGVCLCADAAGPPRVGFLFPGQGAPAHADGGALRRRFAAVDALYHLHPPPAGDGVDTRVAQPAIALASAAALAVLEALGIEGAVAVGHSLGELVALHWAGAMGRAALLRVAAARGAAMGALGGPAGAMLSVGATAGEIAALLDGDGVVVAGINAPGRTVVAGPAAAVDAFAARAAAGGWEAKRLAVSHAFHSPLVAPAAAPLAASLEGEPLRQLGRTVASTVTGAVLPADADLRALLARQVTAPVRFLDAVRAAGTVDLWIEAGPGHALSALVSTFDPAPAAATDACGPSLAGVLRAAAAAWTLGAPVRLRALCDDRFARPFDPDRPLVFFASPCEAAPVAADAEGGGPDAEETADEAGAADVEGAADTPLELVRALVAARVELPAAAVLDDHRMLADLHLNSITVGEIVSQAARRLRLPPPASPTDYAGATVAEAARALAAQAAAPRECEASDDAAPAGVGPWVRAFTVELVERPLPPTLPPPRTGEGEWRIFAPDGHPLAEPLRHELDREGTGGGVAVCLPPEPDERHLPLLLDGVRAALSSPRFLLVQHGGGAASLARTLHLEAPHLAVCVADVPADAPDAARLVADELRAAAGGYVEAWYDAHGVRRVPRLRPAPPAADGEEPPLAAGDVLLASGGAKGITAECALALVRGTGAAAALLGRAPEDDPAVAATLARFAAEGVRVRYLRADVTDAASVRAAVAEAEAAPGPVTALLHGAGVNTPRLLAALDAEAALGTLAPKLRGARNLLAAVDPARLRLVVGLGSIIARMGLPGAGDYALANEWLARLLERFGAGHPACRCLTLEWSVWAETGMGARLGRLDALVRAGVQPIDPAAGAALCRTLLCAPPPASSLVVTGRFGSPPTLAFDAPELPLLRFLQHPRVHVPGVELVADAELSAATDPYLDDHVVQGQPLLPGVMALEACAQAAGVLAGADGPPAFEDVRFERPVGVPGGGSVRVRVCALARADGRVEVVLRSEATAFAADHVRATCRFGAGVAPAAGGAPGGEGNGDGDDAVAVDAAALYGRLFFHGGRFHRVSSYRRLRARACRADVAAGADARWFGAFLPQSLRLGDPGARDAAIHAVQACIPHARVLPVGVRRVWAAPLDPASPHTVRAREVSDDGTELVWDLEVADAAGTVRERWEGLRLRRVGPLEPAGGWEPALLGPYLERSVAERVPGAALAVAVERGEEGETDRRARGDRALRHAAGARVAVRRGMDGRPEMAGLPLAVSASHAGAVTLAVAGPAPLGCDLEPVTARPPALWRDLLGPAGFALAEQVAREADEDFDASATRVWSAREALKKAGAPPAAPLVISRAAGGGWVTMDSADLAVATCVVRLAGDGGAHVAALTTRHLGAEPPRSRSETKPPATLEAFHAVHAP